MQSAPAPRGATIVDIEVAYRRDAARYVRLARAVLGSENEAWDAVQDAFAQALRRRHAFRGDGPVEAWLWHIVLNEARMRARRRPGPAAAGSSPSRPREPGGDEAAVRSAVARLPERQRVALFLRYYADLDYDSIAAVLGISAGTVGPTLAAAQTRLRTMLGEEER